MRFDTKTGLIGVAGGIGATIAGSDLRDEITAWVSLACTVAIAITTCAVQIYRLWKERKKDQSDNEKEE